LPLGFGTDTDAAQVDRVESALQSGAGREDRRGVGSVVARDEKRALIRSSDEQKDLLAKGAEAVESSSPGASCFGVV